MDYTNSKNEFKGVANLHRVIRITYLKNNEIEVLYDIGTKLYYKKIYDEYEAQRTII